MPSLQNILITNEKRLDITNYCKDILDEGETDVWITIKKMSKELKRKISILSMEKINKKTSKAFLKGMKEKGITLAEINDYQKLGSEKTQQVLDIFLDADIDMEEKKKINDFENELEKIIIASCVDKEKHNFFNKKIENGNEVKEKIDISNYDFWDRLGKDNLVFYICDEIKKFSEDFFFEKNGETKSNGQ